LKKIIPMSMVALLATTGLAAQAQTSNVTVYGYLDLGLVKESGSPTRMERGFNNWLGFRGTENLDDDLSAVFNIQMRFNPDTGAQEKPTTLFQGESTVGLHSKKFGTVRLGRAWTPLWSGKWIYDPWYDSGVMGSVGNYNGSFDSDGLPSVDFHNFLRVSNAVFYNSPAVAGFQLNAEAETEKPQGAKARSTGIALHYAKGPLSTMLAWQENHLSDTIAYVGASYTFAALTVMGSYSRTEFDGSANKLQSMMLAGTYALGANAIRFGYGRIKEDGSNKISAGYLHALSKRSNLYADIYRERTAGRLNGVALGMNHTF